MFHNIFNYISNICDNINHKIFIVEIFMQGSEPRNEANADSSVFWHKTNFLAQCPLYVSARRDCNL